MSSDYAGSSSLGPVEKRLKSVPHREARAVVGCTGGGVTRVRQDLGLGS